MTHRRCGACATQFVSPRPDASLLKRFYAESANYRYWAEHVFPASEDVRRDKIFRPRAEIVAEITREAGLTDGVLVEVGSAYGLFCDEARKLGLFRRIVGIEPTPDLAEICRSMGIETVESSFEDAGLPEPADVIASFEVIEHLFSPETFLAWCLAALVPGGHLVVTCPNIAGFETTVLGAASGTVDHEHLNLFTPTSLRLLAERVGFVDVDVVTPGRLDFDIVRAAYREGEVGAAALGPFIAGLASTDDSTVGELFQDFLMHAGMSSNMRMIARRPR